MRIGITGASGFLGRYLIDEGVRQGHQMIAWSRSRPAKPRPSDVQWIQGELADPANADALAQSCDAIIHTAVAREDASFVADPEDPVAYFQTNVIGSLQLIEAAARANVQRFVFLSSGAVHDRVLAERTLDESHPLWPSSIYGASKAAIETLVHAYGWSGKLEVCTLRPTAIYGLADPPERSKWFDLVRDIAAGQDVQADGGGKMVHVADVARAAMKLVTTSDPIAGETFNCCDRLISRFEVAQIAKRLSASTSQITGTPKESRNAMDVTKLKSLGVTFGGTPLLQETIESMLRST